MSALSSVSHPPNALGAAEDHALGERGETFEGSSSPAWPKHVAADNEVHNDSHYQELENDLDEYFSVDMSNLPPGFSAGYDYDPSEPEIQEYPGDAASM